MDAADHCINHLSSTHRPRNDLVYGSVKKKSPPRNERGFFLIGCSYHTRALFSLGMNILSVGWMLKASYQLSIIGRAAFTRKICGE